MADSLNKKIAIGYLWNLVAKWITRSIGIISTLILIRLLKPEDFGIATLASITIALFMVLSHVGVEKYLIKSKECNNDLLNSAWSLNIVLKVLSGVIIAGFSGSIALFTHEPELKNVLLLCSVIPVIGAMSNIGLIHYERELNYKPLARLSVVAKLIVFPVTVGLAVWLKNYWALIIGSLTSECINAVGSYFIHPYRPVWSVKQWGRLWDFSKWMLLSTITGYIRSRIDAFLLGRFLPSDAVGTFRISQEFAWLPFSELISPATSSFYSGISKISHNREELYDKIVKYQAIAYLLVIPSVLGIYALKDLIVVVVMGEQWLSATPIIGLLSFLMLSMPLNMVLQTVLISLSKVKYLVFIDLIMITSIVLVFFLLHQENVHSLQVFTLARVILVIAFISLLLAAYKILLKLNLKRLSIVCIMPVLPGMIMLWSIERMEVLLNFSQAVNLIILVFLGILIFMGSMFLLIVLVKTVLPDYLYIYKFIIRACYSIKQKFAF
ncbi:oligosaccharide flippase family protein [Vibrio salinus]|uniref:oligosaccharide flippase family protein n=1 Tax=Vibrio salinus TaxID=2899784 RepID=UPI001E5A81D9|nr:oligosaccharide flippase family protein [Vibrio salinus]MCE0493277.1 oligosaccharide flippase family protein [Vibrio salinus]